MLVPWVTPIIVVGIIWRWIYDGNYGLLNYYLQQSGLIDRYVVWLADGRFPLAISLRQPAEEEERRLFYVAATRARDELYLTYPLTAAPRDDERTLLKISRFVEELPDGEKAPYDRVQIEVAPPALALGLAHGGGASGLPAVHSQEPRRAAQMPRLVRDRGFRGKPGRLERDQRRRQSRGLQRRPRRHRGEEVLLGRHLRVLRRSLDGPAAQELAIGCGNIEETTGRLSGDRCAGHATS